MYGGILPQIVQRLATLDHSILYFKVHIKIKRRFSLKIQLLLTLIYVDACAAAVLM